jgi:hypothetical protein
LKAGLPKIIQQIAPQFSIARSRTTRKVLAIVQSAKPALCDTPEEENPSPIQEMPE